MIYSYSALADYQLCPRYFKAKYIDKKMPFVETEAMARGNRLHKGMENALNLGHDIPREYKGNHGFVELLRKYEARPEVKIGVTDDWRGCQFFHSLVKLRGKIDVYLPMVKKKRAIMIDWKTGNPNYTDEFQADVYAAMICSATIMEKVLFIWGYFSGETPYKIVDGAQAQDKVASVIRAAEVDREYPPRPCWKCRFCELKTCEYNENREVFA